VKDLLVLGASAPEMDLLRARLARLGYRPLPAKEPHQAHMLLRVAGGRVGAVVVPSDLPVVELRPALDALRRHVPGGRIAFLGAGREPGLPMRNRMRDAGVAFAAFDPVDLHTLRFQVNRALADGEALRMRGRDTARAPADWPVTVRVAGREKKGRLYSVSATGAYVAIDQPSIAGSQVGLELTLPGERRLKLAGRVVMTNVPGNLIRRSLPLGMGVCFDQLSDAASVALLVYAEDRLKQLAM
jgi:hypothetical protein